MNDLPPFWAALNAPIFGEYWHHMCDDIEECTDHTHPPPPLNEDKKVSVPECGECFGRIAVAQQALGNDLTISEIQQLLADIDFCENFIQDPADMERCTDALTTFVPAALIVLASAPQDWAMTFCNDVWGC